MKKIVVLILLIGLTFAGKAQTKHWKLLRPVDITIFEGKKSLGAMSVNQSSWVPRLNVGMVGFSYDVKDFNNPIPFDGILYGFGYLHYKNANEVPFNDFGINLGIVQNTKTNGFGLGLFGTYNTGLANNLGLLNAGSHYDFHLKRLLIDVGLTFHY